MGTDKRALAALDTEILVPRGDLDSNVALLVLRGACGPCAVIRHRADRNVVALLLHERRGDVLNELRCIAGYRRRHRDLAGRCGGHFNLLQLGNGAVNSNVVHTNDLVTLFAVRLLDGGLEGVDRLVLRQHAGDGEEAGLHDRIDACAETQLMGEGDRVDHVELDLLVDDLLLDFVRHVIPNVFSRVGACKQEHGTVLCVREHVILLKEGEVVACHEVSLRAEVGAADEFGAEAQMRNGHGSGLLRVIHEVALSVILSIRTNDLNRVLIGADRTV